MASPTKPGRIIFFKYIVIFLIVIINIYLVEVFPDLIMNTLNILITVVLPQTPRFGVRRGLAHFSCCYSLIIYPPAQTYGLPPQSFRYTTVHFHHSIF